MTHICMMHMPMMLVFRKPLPGCFCLGCMYPWFMYAECMYPWYMYLWSWILRALCRVYIFMNLEPRSLTLMYAYVMRRSTDAWCMYPWCIYQWSLILMHVCIMHVCMLHVSMILDPWPWCMYVWCMYLRSWILIAVCMMHLSMILDPRSLTDPDVCMCDAA